MNTSTSIKSRLPGTPLTLVKLIKTVFNAYPRIFSRVWILVLLSSLVQPIVPLLAQYNWAFAAVAFLGFVLLTWFLYIAILCLSDVALKGGHITFSSAFRIAKQRYLLVLGSNIIFFTIGAFAFILEYAIQLLLAALGGEFPLSLVVSAIINVFIFVMLYFAIPLIALEHLPILKAFQRSAALVRHHWWRTFMVLAVVGGVILGFEALGILFTGEMRLFLFTGYHFFLQIIFYPLIISATLVLLNDLKLRYQHVKNS